MLGGMSGGGMGFIFAPEKKASAQQRLQELMSATKRDYYAILGVLLSAFSLGCRHRSVCGEFPRLRFQEVGNRLRVEVGNVVRGAHPGDRHRRVVHQSAGPG